MNNNFKQFSREDLNFNDEIKSFWNNNGYLVLKDFYKINECNNLIARSKELIDSFDHEKYKSIFDTLNQEHSEDQYFLQSGDKIRFFLENKAIDQKGNFVDSKELVINKIGHALHDLDPVFYKFTHRELYN